MWATFPNITEAVKVLEAWGFTYKTAAFVWIKKNRRNGGNFWGMGAYTRANAEVCLLHDVCKVGVYHTETRRRKNPATGFWEDCQAYVFRDPLPLGHGEKSVYLIQRHMDLEPEEAMAIRWHMGAYDSAVKGGARDMGVAMNMTPWVWRLQQADMCATYVDEREEPEE